MKVLVPTDGSEHAMKAVQRALELAEKLEADITLMSVAPFAKDALEDMPPNIQEKLDREYSQILAQAKAVFDQKNIKVETVFEIGTVPANNILRKAEEGKFDRIIMGSAGKSGLMKFIMGSTAAKVVAHAPCEVTVVR